MNREKRLKVGVWDTGQCMLPLAVLRYRVAKERQLFPFFILLTYIYIHANLVTQHTDSSIHNGCYL